MNIAVDGPAGSGKSTLCRRLAAELGYIYIDTGAMYRAIALYCLQNGANTENESEVVRLLPQIALNIVSENGEQAIYLNGNNINAALRGAEVSMGASSVARYKAVRKFLLNTQQNLAKGANVVMDGRDIGTVVLPGAEVKIYLTASAGVRAARRHKELVERGAAMQYEEVLAAVLARDEQDINRKEAPLKVAQGAVTLDTTGLTTEQALAAMLDIVKKAQ